MKRRPIHSIIIQPIISFSVYHAPDGLIVTSIPSNVLLARIQPTRNAYWNYPVCKVKAFKLEYDFILYKRY